MAAAERTLAGVTVAFDLDGTLVDTAPDLIGTLNVLLAAEGIEPLPLEQARPYIGHGARRLIERGFLHAGQPLEARDLDRLFTAFIARYRAHIADESRPFPGCEAALVALTGAGARLCVCTNKPTGLSVALLEALGMAVRFGSIVGPDAAGCAKPDPRHLIAAVDAAGGDPGRTILVGDSAADAGAARAAGAGLILVDFGYTETPAAELEPDELIAHFDELPAACLRLLAACERGADRL